MKKFILIQNDGEIETNSFELIGASTKRGDASKIGFFGSGLKYSIAYMMRNQIEFRIFSGHQEIKFTTINENLKGQIFQRICINGVPTSYTTTMGPTWTEDWFVIREIYCNAVDEGTCQMVRETKDINPSEGKTRVYIEITEKMKDVMENWDAFFSDEREPLFVGSDIYTSSGANGDGGTDTQNIKIYKKTAGVLYRRGIRIATNAEQLYDYEAKFWGINEDRTAKERWPMDYLIADLMGTFVSEEYVKTVLSSVSENHSDLSKEYKAIMGTRGGHSKGHSHKWVEFSQNNLLILREVSGRYRSEAANSRKPVYYIPSYFAKHLKKHLPDVKILGMGKAIGESYMEPVETTAKMEFLIKEVKTSLKEMGYETEFPIEVVKFDSEGQLGEADILNKMIFLSEELFDKGRREIALTIIEETEHIRSGEGDETRAFQNHIFSQWLKTMENGAGLFL